MCWCVLVCVVECLPEMVEFWLLGNVFLLEAIDF